MTDHRRDAPSWIHVEFGRGALLLFDRGYAPKSASFRVRESLAAGGAARDAPALRMWAARR